VYGALRMESRKNQTCPQPREERLPGLFSFCGNAFRLLSKKGL
jgi:hypothetical protein